MKFTVSRDALIAPLNLVAGVVERRQTLPILANVLLSVSGQKLSITGTDLEVELVGRLNIDQPVGEEGEITVPAKKLADICKSLPDGSDIEFSLDDQKVIVKAGRSRFTLTSLPASDFPSVEQGQGKQNLVLKQSELKRLIDRTAFAMAQQDVRYYLNGMLWELKNQQLRVVATDGHRLALCTLESSNIQVDEARQVILPRKGVIELARLLTKDEDSVELFLGDSHVQAITEDFTFTSKLVDGKFPDYDRVLPKSNTRALFANREVLKNAFTRAAILSNEKYRGVRLILTDGNLEVIANNPEQEEAEEMVQVDFSGERLEIGFNVSYLLDVLGVLSGENIKILLADANSSALLQESDQDDSRYVVMPMRL